MTKPSDTKRTLRSLFAAHLRRERWCALLMAAAMAWAGSACEHSRTAGARVMVLGIDGGTWDVIEPMMAAGQLPHIKKLYDEGLHGVLESRPPTLSPVVWTTIFTGFLAKTHGVTDWKTSQSTNRRVSALWEINSRNELESNVFNVPGSWPPEPLDGVMLSGFPLSGSTYGGNTGEVVTGAQLELGRTTAAYRDNLDEIRARTAALADGQWTPWFAGKVSSRPKFQGVMRAKRLAPDKFYLTPLYRVDDELVVTEPSDLRARIAAQLGEPYIPEGPGWSRWDKPDTPDFLYQHLQQVFDIQSRAALGYAAGDWDLFAYVMTLVDRVSHPYWAYSHPDDFPQIDRERARRYESAVADAYRATDAALGAIVGGARQNGGRDLYVVVVSDHGFTSSRDRTKQVGAHDSDGIYLVWGPGVGAAEGGRAFIEDVTPTVLYLMGMPVGQDMDGSPIAEVTSALGRAVETVATHEKGARRASDRPVDDATWEQLRGLGYVDGAAPRQQMQRQRDDRDRSAAGPDRPRRPMPPARPSKPAKPAKPAAPSKPATSAKPSKPAAPSADSLEP